jgi:GNAT superfamily N-acetyltransferase
VLELREVDYGSERYREVVAFRRRLLRMPLGLDFTAEQLAAERADTHVAAYLEGELVGCIVLAAVDASTVKLRQMAVRPDHQGRGLGARIVEFAESLAAERGCREIVLNARESAVRFYEHAGYAVTGEIFTEVTIPHRSMVKRLAAEP